MRGLMTRLFNTPCLPYLVPALLKLTFFVV